VAAWAGRQPFDPVSPDLGSLRADVLWLFTRVAMRMDSMMSEAIAGVMAEAFKHPEVQALLRNRMDSAPVTDAMRTIVDRAVARGELKPLRLPTRVTVLPAHLVRAEAILIRTPISDETLAGLVDDVYLPLLKGLALD
jgi:hypothetical protein